MMKKLFLPRRLAVIAKEKGFDGLCLAMYNEGDYPHVRGSFGNLWKNNDQGLLTAPLYQEIIDWFWDKHKIEVQPAYRNGGKWHYLITDEHGKVLSHNVTEHSREDTRNEAIERAFTHIP